MMNGELHYEFDPQTKTLNATYQPRVTDPSPAEVEAAEIAQEAFFQEHPETRGMDFAEFAAYLDQQSAAERAEADAAHARWEAEHYEGAKAITRSVMSTLGKTKRRGR